MANFPNVVSADWLADHLGDPDLVVVDCRFALADSTLGQRQYEEGHIPGAFYLDLNRDLSSPVQPHGGRHPLPDIDTFGQCLGSLGIASATPTAGPTRVVAYDDSRFAFASRLWWLLKYLGHDAVAVLDGGWASWQQGGYPTRSETSTATPKDFIPQPQPGWVVSRDEVRRRQGSGDLVLVDSRSPERYRGEVEPIDPIAGHIPGAVNRFWQEVSGTDGQMRSPAELTQHWASLGNTAEAVVYCGSGVTACVNLLSQAVAGQPLSQLYVGGWSDWCSYEQGKNMAG